MHISQPLGREEATKQRIGDHGRLDTRVMDQRLCGNSAQTAFGAAWLRRSSGTPLRENITKIHLAANQGKSGEAASRKPEETEAIAIDLRRAGPSTKHEIDQSLDVGRAIGQRCQWVYSWSRSGERPLSLG